MYENKCQYMKKLTKIVYLLLWLLENVLFKNISKFFAQWFKDTIVIKNNYNF